MTDRTPVFYKLVNSVTGHYYLGATDKWKRREKEHLREIERGTKPKLWQRLWNDHPELRDRSLWRLVVVRRYKTLERAVEREAQALQAHVGRPLCLNQMRSGTGGVFTQEHRAKLKGKTRSAETRAKIKKAVSGENNWLYGCYGENHPTFGRKHSKEARDKMAEARKAYWARKRAERDASKSSS